MTTSDGERIAPVTYLFGAPQPQQAETEQQPSPSEAPSAPEPPSAPSAPEPPSSRVVFRAEPDAPEQRGRFQPINNVSMNALARRGMSAEEMAAYLAGRDFDEGEVELECERLLGVGLLDDLALAETLVRTLRERKGFGRSAIVAELRRRKLDQSAIDEALEDLDGDDELDRAIAIAEKRAPQLRSLDAETAKRRLGAFLMRKGYSGSIVSTAVARALTPTGPVFR
jgi:SOS response regulatory protein OraA/RecX